MASRFDSFSMSEMDLMWNGMYDHRENLRKTNFEGMYDVQIKAIDDMFLEMYRSANWGRKPADV